MSFKQKAIVEHIIYEFFGKGNLSKYEDFTAKDIEAYAPKSWGKILPTTDLHGQKKVKQVDLEYSSAFCLKKVDIEDLLIGEDKILSRWSCEGFHKGNFFDIKASQRSFHLTGQSVYQFNKENQVSKVWQSWDMLGLLEQIQSKPLFLPKNHSLKNIELLSSQERKCLKFLLDGKTAKETALLLNISFRTVEYYFENIKNKLQCFRKKDLFPYAKFLENNLTL